MFIGHAFYSGQVSYSLFRIFEHRRRIDLVRKFHHVAWHAGLLSILFLAAALPGYLSSSVGNTNDWGNRLTSFALALSIVCGVISFSAFLTSLAGCRRVFFPQLKFRRACRELNSFIGGASDMTFDDIKKAADENMVRLHLHVLDAFVNAQKEIEEDKALASKATFTEIDGMGLESDLNHYLEQTIAPAMEKIKFRKRVLGQFIGLLENEGIYMQKAIKMLAEGGVMLPENYWVPSSV